MTECGQYSSLIWDDPGIYIAAWFIKSMNLLVTLCKEKHFLPPKDVFTMSAAAVSVSPDFLVYLVLVLNSSISLHVALYFVGNLIVNT